MQISTPRSSSAQQVRGLELMNGTLFAPSRPLVAKLSSMIKKLFSGFTCRPMVVVFHVVDDDMKMMMMMVLMVVVLMMI